MKKAPSFITNRKQQYLLGLLFGLVLAVVFQYSAALAGVADSMRGFAWGGTSSSNGAYQGIGWISMNSLSDGSGVNYGVNIPFTDGPLSGYAWSEHYGWISFNGGDLSGCSPALSQATRSGNNITGGARILSIRNEGANSGGFDGCISLSGPGYGLTINGSNSPYSLSGYAWSSDLGWIDFSGVTSEYTSTATLSVNPCTVSIGSNTCSGSATWDIQNSSSPSLYNDTNSLLYSTNQSGTNVSITLFYGNNDVVARNNGSIVETVPVNISCETNGIFDAGSGVCIDGRVNFYSDMMTHTTSGVLNGSRNYTYINVIFDIQNNGGGDYVSGADYSMQFESFDGSTYNTIDTITGPIDAINAGGSFRETVQVSDVPFGNYRVTVQTDTPIGSGGNVDEIDESDNETIFTGTVYPPAPDIRIDTVPSRKFVRVGETVDIRWTAGLIYPMDCTVQGPGVDIDAGSFPGFPGSVTDIVINSKSEFVLECTEPLSGAVFSDTTVVEVSGTLEEI